MEEEKVNSSESSSLAQVFGATAGVALGLVIGRYGPEQVMNDPIKLIHLQTAAIIFMPMLGFLGGDKLGDLLGRSNVPKPSAP